jgi:putative transposon-encoded protein
LPAEDDEKINLKPEDAYWIDIPQCKLIQANYLDSNFIIKSKEYNIKLGDTVRHTYTGLEGYVTQIAIWVSGCTRVSIQPVGINTKTGSVYESTWVSTEELEIISQSSVTPVKTGGPFDAPKKMSVPKKY